MRSTRRLAFAVVCLLWAGFVTGVAFAEAVKFRTPTLPRSVAFDVGRTVFGASQWAQICLTGIALASAAVGRVPRWAWRCLAVAGATLLVQRVFLFPVLEARAQASIAGGVPAGASAHGIYSALEVLKLLALVTGAVLALQPPKPSP